MLKFTPNTESGQHMAFHQGFPLHVGEAGPNQPEIRLWTVCLSHAIATTVGLIRCDALKLYRARDRRWLISDRRVGVGSCNWVCDVLGLDRKELVTFVWKNRHALRKDPLRLRSISW